MMHLGLLDGTTYEVPDEVLAALADHQNPDGGFRGRGEGSDLYFTTFAVNIFSLAGSWSSADMEGAVEFIGSTRTKDRGYGPRPGSKPDLIHTASGLVALDLMERLDPEDLARFTRYVRGFQLDGGGYGLGPGKMEPSPYHSFLAYIVYSLTRDGSEIAKDKEKDMEALLALRNDDKGFCGRPGGRSITTLTAAAIGTMFLLGSVEEVMTSGDFIKEASRSDGGFGATVGFPVSDLLSTHTSLVSLMTLGLGQEIDIPTTREYIRSLEDGNGGYGLFHGDKGSDPETLYYSIGTLALLHSLEGGD